MIVTEALKSLWYPILFIRGIINPPTEDTAAAAEPEIAPNSMVDASIEDLRACGVSMRKAEYIKGIAEAAANGEINLEALHELPDEEVIERLSSLRGVGVWTAEMMLIFSMGRMDVVSYGDLAIRRGMMRLYGLEELDRGTFDAYRERYSPYGTVASLYLWRVAHE